MRSATTCKICRRLGVSVCGREKCALKRKPYPPGIHGKAFRRGGSEFGQQLKEKQKVKYLYGLRERQFSNYISAAMKQKTIPTQEAILSSLERRLDNIIYRSGFAPTRAASRQMVNHGHISVNGKRVTIPSYDTKIGDEVEIRPLSRQKGLFNNLEISLKKFTPPDWIILDKTALKAKISAHPPAGELVKGYNVNAIVEYYSR